MAIKFQATTPKPGVDAWPDASRPLPPFVRDYIERGAAEGTRNDTIHKVAQQFMACGYSQDEALSYILPRATADGTKEGETRQAVRSAFKSSKVTEPITVASGGKRAAEPSAKPAENDTLRALRAAFLPGESIAIVESRENEEGEWKPSVATIKTLEEWEKWLKKMGDINRLFSGTAGGAFIGINPVKAGSQSRGNDNVAVFRHVLVEWDGDMSLAEQASKIEASGLPVSVMLTSGGKSVHAWVRVDAKDAEEWRVRRDFLFDQFQCDPKNKDLARVSRCPGAMRGDKEQKVLAVNLGPKSWAEYEERRMALPPIRTLFQLIEQPTQKPAELISGLLFPGCKLIIGSSSKGRKSWVLLDLALSVSSGWEWLGRKTVKGPVLYINFELKDWMVEERIGVIGLARGMRMVADASKNLHVWNLRGHSAPIANLAPMILDRIKTTPYALIIFDPIYKGLGGDDENDAGDMNILFNQMENVCQQTGAALAMAHHFAKGDPWDKEPLDRLSGSGVFARDPDSVVVMTPGRVRRGEKDAREGVVAPEDKGSLVFMDVILRASAPVKGGWLRWRHGYFCPEGGQGTKCVPMLKGHTIPSPETEKPPEPAAT